MSQNNDQRDPDEIESEIHQTRQRLDSTLHELEERISPQKLWNSSYEYLRGGGANEFISNLGESVKQHPLPFLMTSVGLGWMMLAQRQPQPHGTSSHSRPSAPSRPHESMATGSGIAADRPYGSVSSHQGGSVSSHPGNSGATSSSSASSAGATPSTSHSSTGKGRVKETTDNVKEKTQHMTDKLTEGAQHMRESWQDKTSHAQQDFQERRHEMAQRARRVGSQSTDFIQEHPLVAGAMGFAIGAALGSMLPATRIEDEYLGDYRDRALDKATESGQSQLDKAQKTLHEKTEETRAKAQGGGKDGTSESDSDQAATGTSSSAANVTTPTSSSPSSSRPTTGGAVPPGGTSTTYAKGPGPGPGQASSSSTPPPRST